MSAKIPMKDMIVILPGITGSVLQKDGKDLWAVSGQAIWQILRNPDKSLQYLKLVQDDPEADGLPNIDKRKAEDALAFHREIETAVEQHLKLEEYRQSFTVVPITGVQQPTLQSAILQNGKLTASEDLPGVLQNRFDLSDGDGTVPQVSAIPIERSGNFDNFFIAEQHGALQNQKQVLQNLLNCLELSQFDLATVKAPQVAISLSLDDLYLPDEPVSIRARVTGPISFGKLQAEITSVSHEQPPVTVDFVERERDWLLTIDGLKQGLYRVRVQTENLSDQAPIPVHDLFEVVR